MADLSKISDFVRATRATELQRGGWVDLVAQLKDYALSGVLLPRRIERTSDRLRLRVTVEDNVNNQFNTDGFVTGPYRPLQVHVGENVKTIDIKLSHVRQAMAISDYEIELNRGGSDNEQLLDIFTQRKTDQLEIPLMSKLELKLAGAPVSEAAMTLQDVFGLKYWFPRKAGATDLEINGGGDPVGFPNGAANLTVADAPRWAHAVCGFNKVADDDLFRKLQEFRVRVNTYKPETGNTLNSPGTNRCILVQTPVYLSWSHLQVVANDNPGRDLGRERADIMFMGTPVKVLYVISTPGSPERPTDHGLLYDLDLDSIKLQMHSAFNFQLQEQPQADQPRVRVIFREAYMQLGVEDREKSLVGTTSNEDLYQLT